MTHGAIDKAQKALASARILLDAGDADGATNRAYYAMFDAALAALDWTGTRSAQQPQHKTHGGLIRSFSQHLVQTGQLPIEFGRSLNRVQDLRLTADYFVEPLPLDKAKWAIEEAEKYLSGVRKLLDLPASE